MVKNFVQTALCDPLQYGEIYNFPQAVFEKALDDEEMEEDTEAGDEESASELEDEHEVCYQVKIK